MTVQWFGVSTLLFSDGDTRILIDGFFSRPSRLTLVFNRLMPDEVRIDDALGKGKITKVDAIVVAHSHYDHAMDSARVAQKTDALLVGSESSLRIARAAGLRDRLCTVRDGDRVKVGNFEIEIFATPHAPTLLEGTVDPAIRYPGRLLQYKLGANYSFLIRHPLGYSLVIPSANSRPGMLRGARADVVFLGVGGLGKRDADDIGRYWRETVQESQAALAIPIHWDDFTRPLSAPLRPPPSFIDNVDHTFASFAKLAGAHGNGVQIKSIPLLTPVSLPLVRRPAAQAGASFACASR